ncbi:MAG: hypothetical protein Fur0044_01530 [Anaerolineae bacterium]|nr:hypothetical protein [Anaerolineales bacterium]MCQ3975995.1 hypothetical protein [Anaerolineae bacterium]
MSQGRSLGVISLIVAVLAILGLSDAGLDVFRPPLFAPAPADETLIVIATFYEPGATPTEPHTQIRQAIEAAAQEAGLDSLRVEEEPTVLRADEHRQAETLGNLHHASMIIWGEATGEAVLVNFLNLKQPDAEVVEVKINEAEPTQLANLDAYARLSVSVLEAMVRRR